ncbi:MAG TPA: beta-ketoacyl synthase N-terminal-like domain-containing protein [Myxococcota bacterium]|nr:beta-ketoacyl synthase N-terminal-like domain-containing protein [Myxococcota bacterium]HRY95800.1 beta-ketoacyl synthase N-terminal-like domain-containing protein [Myxococcota bacterium]HSA23409.1 beta-ketoacyl synthase N-terminal-like domain-containing protein [Myxococcota bacterium]
MSAPGRTLVTGAGLHTAFGDGPESLAALQAGRRALRAFELAGAPGFPALPGAPCPPPPTSGFLADRKLQKYMSPTAELAVVVCARALAAAALSSPPEDTSLYLATGLIAFDLAAVYPTMAAGLTADGRPDYAYMGAEGIRRCNPLMPFKMLLNMPLGLASIALGLRGENAILYPGAGQAGAALEAALRGLRRGRAGCALVGGSGQALSLLPLCTALRADQVPTTAEAARPFAPGHRGLAPADQGAALVLEQEPAARARGARPLAALERVSVAWGPRQAAGATDLLAEVLRDASGGPPPPVLLVTGSPDAAGDAALVSLCARLWPARPPALLSLDGLLGFSEPAAFPAALAVASLCLAAGAPLPGDGPQAGPPSPPTPDRVLVTAVGPDGGLSAALLAAPEVGA